MSDASELKGLGGWLIIIGIGLFMSPITIVIELGPIFYSILADGVIPALSNPLSEFYNPLLLLLIFGELVINFLMTVVSVYLIYLFFSKHYQFPKVYIAVTIISVIILPLDAWLGSLVFPNQPFFDEESWKYFYKSIAAAMIWIPYMLMSQRVKATFVEKRPENQLQPTTAAIG